MNLKQRLKAVLRLPEKPSAWTEYLDWLSFANAGMLDRGNVECFDYALRRIETDSPMIEIGSFCGLSTNVLTYLKEKHGRTNKLVTCDRWIFECETPTGSMLGDSKTVSHADYREFVKDSFIRNVRTFSWDLPYTLELFSDELFAAWTGGESRQDVFGRNIQLGGPISFCYIDGNHSYEFVRRDFENANRFLEVGGFLLFDDSSPHSIGDAYRVAIELAADSHYKVISHKPHYFLQKQL